jgi:hypothetical protein
MTIESHTVDSTILVQAEDEAERTSHSGNARRRVPVVSQFNVAMHEYDWMDHASSFNADNL